MVDYSQPDLTQHPPRALSVRLGGCAHLPRMLDKARALAAGKNGEYNYPCPLDEMLLEFLGIDAEALLTQVGNCGSDTDLLTWVTAHTKRSQLEIAAWSAWIMARSPGSAEGHGNFSTAIQKLAPEREDIQTISDRLNLDDYVSFGGKG